MILVTGASGHIGNVLVRTLVDLGRPVRALVRSGDRPPALTGIDIEVAPGDILDIKTLRSALEGVDVVYHLAARISIAPASEADLEQVNVQGTRNVLDAARTSGVSRLVFASSVYAMRLPAEGVVDEDCPFDPSAARGPYDRSKALASLEVLEAARRGQDVVIASPTAVVGPFDFRASEAGRGIRMNLSPGIKFFVDGGYDFVDVRDVAQGLILAAERGKPGHNYILGGNYLTIQEVARAVWGAVGGWHFGVRMPDWAADLAASFAPIFSDSPLVTSYSLSAIRSNSNISHRKAEQDLGYHPRPACQAVVDAARWWISEQNGTPFFEMTSGIASRRS